MSSTDSVKKAELNNNSKEILTPEPKPEPVVDADPPRKCKDCKLDIKPHPGMWRDYCESCLDRYGSGAGSRHF